MKRFLFCIIVAAAVGAVVHLCAIRSYHGTDTSVSNPKEGFHGQCPIPLFRKD